MRTVFTIFLLAISAPSAFVNAQACQEPGRFVCSGDGYKICQRNLHGTLTFTPTQSCGIGNTCASFGKTISCIAQANPPPPPPVNQCQVDDQRCFSTMATQTCIVDPVTHTTNWGPAVACPAKTACSQGFCRDVTPPPPGQCSGPYKQCFNATAFRYCITHDNAPGQPRFYSEPELCNNGSACKNDKCVSDECEILFVSHPDDLVPQTECLSWNTYRFCVFDEKLGHNVWGQPRQCSPFMPNCRNRAFSGSETCGQLPIVGKQCSDSERICSSMTSYVYCNNNVWTTATCPSGTNCLSGNCLASGTTDNTCKKSGQQKCVSTTAFQTCIYNARQQLEFDAQQNCPKGTFCRTKGTQIQCS